MTKESPPQWLDTQEQAFWRSFLHGQKALQEQLDADLIAGAGISLDDYEVLSMLSEAEDSRMRMSVLADLVLMGRSRLTYRIDRLEATGLVRRETCPNDRRGAFAVLTCAGLEIVKRSAPVHVSSVRKRFVNRLDNIDLPALTTVFESIIESQTGRP